MPRSIQNGQTMTGRSSSDSASTRRGRWRHGRLVEVVAAVERRICLIAPDAGAFNEMNCWPVWRVYDGHWLAVIEAAALYLIEPLMPPTERVQFAARILLWQRYRAAHLLSTTSPRVSGLGPTRPKARSPPTEPIRAVGSNCDQPSTGQSCAASTCRRPIVIDASAWPPAVVCGSSRIGHRWRLGTGAFGRWPGRRMRSCC